MNFGPQHMVERGQEMVTKIEGELLYGLHLNTQVEYEDTKESQALAKMSFDDLDKNRHVFKEFVCCLIIVPDKLCLRHSIRTGFPELSQ